MGDWRGPAEETLTKEIIKGAEKIILLRWCTTGKESMSRKLQSRCNHSCFKMTKVTREIQGANESEKVA